MLCYHILIGDVVILHLQAARFLIKCYHDARKGNNTAVPSVCSYLLGKTPQSPPSGDFTNLSYLLDLFRYRARWAVEEAGERLGTLLKQGKRQDEAWNSCAAVLGYLLFCLKGGINTQRGEKIRESIKREKEKCGKKSSICFKFYRFILLYLFFKEESYL